ncbi:MAG: solute carrier family 23 protein [Chthoniobacterales bacterium]
MPTALINEERKRPPNLVYAVDEWPPPFRLVLLGTQYAVMSSIYLVLVVIVLREAHASPAASIQVMGIACVGLAIGTALQALPRGPIGSGFLAPPVFSAVYLAPSVLAARIGGLPLVFGMTIFAGIVEVLFAFALNRLRVVVTPILSGLTVFVVGLQLGVVGIGETLDVRHVDLPTFPFHLIVTSLTLLTCIALSIWARGTLKLLCTLIALVMGMTAAWCVGLITPDDLKTFADPSWLAWPQPSWLHLDFNPGLIPAFLASGVAAGLRAVGVITTCQRLNNAAWRRPDTRNIRKGVLADGLSNVIGGSLGVTGMSIGPSLVGVSGATGATSRAIGFVASLVLLVFAVSPRLSGIFLLVPQEVAGSLLTFTAAFMISGGMEIMLSRKIDTRAVYVIGVSTLLAMSEKVFPAYFRALPKPIQTFTSSPLALGLTFAIGLTLIFRLGTLQSREIKWTDSTASINSINAFLQDQAKAWRIPEAIIEACGDHATRVIQYVLGAHFSGREGTLRASYNGVDLRLEIIYSGSHADRIPESRRRQELVASEFENEESAAWVGLQHFLRGLAVERQQVKTKAGQIIIRLFYAV